MHRLYEIHLKQRLAHRRRRFRPLRTVYHVVSSSSQTYPMMIFPTGA